MPTRKRKSEFDELINRGLKHKKKGELDKAIDYFERIIKLDPENTNAFFELGLLYDEKGEINIAISYFEKVIEIEPDEVSTYYNLGQIYCENGNLNLAINYLEKAIELKPEDEEILTDLAELKEKLAVKKHKFTQLEERLNHIIKNYSRISLKSLAKMLNFKTTFELQQFVVDLSGEKSYYIEGEYLVIPKNIEYKKSKHEAKLICFYCGLPLEFGEEKCSSCNKAIIKCNVCKLAISFGDEAGKCSLCESIGHMDHFQEWVKTQGKCPTCMQKLPIDGIVPISEEIKK